MKKLQKFEEFLKQVQTTYTDEFNDLSEIDTRYRRLSDTNALLQTRHNQSGGQTDALIGQMDAFKRESDVKTLSFTNRIAAEQRGLQDIEEQKAQLMIGNDEKTEQLLKKTSEHGTILMSIDSLYKKVAVKNEQNGMDTNFTQHKSGDVRDDAASGSMPVFTEKTCARASNAHFVPKRRAPPKPITGRGAVTLAISVPPIGVPILSNTMSVSAARRRVTCTPAPTARPQSRLRTIR